MFALLHSLGMFGVDLFKSRRRLIAENLFLRHQLGIALRRAPQRLRLRGSDRALLVLMTRLWPSLLRLSRVVQPDTPEQASYDSAAFNRILGNFPPVLEAFGLGCSGCGIAI